MITEDDSIHLKYPCHNTIDIGNFASISANRGLGNRVANEWAPAYTMNIFMSTSGVVTNIVSSYHNMGIFILTIITGAAVSRNGCCLLRNEI